MKLIKYACAALTVLSLNTKAVCKNKTISLKGKNVEYIFNNAKQCDLQGIIYKGKKINLKSKANLYQLIGDIWSNCSKMPPEWKVKQCPIELKQAKNRTTLIAKAVCEKLKITHVYELKKDSDVLDIYTTYETTKPQKLRWCYMESFSFPPQSKFIRAENVTRNGTISPQTKVYEKSLFLNPDGSKKLVAPYKFRIYPLYNEPVVGFLDKNHNYGVILAVKPEACNKHFFRTGQSAPDKDYFASLMNEKMAATKNGKWYYMKSSMEINPFENTPAKLHKTVVVPLFKYLHKSDLIFAKDRNTGKCLASSNQAALWVNSTTVNIVKSEKVPKKKADSVKISLAKGETEGVQLVLKPLKNKLSNVTISFSALTCGNNKLPITAISYNPLQYFKSTFASTPMDALGEVPDILLPAKPVECPQNTASVFYLKVSAPYKATTGSYSGKIIVSANGKTLFNVPLSVKIWNFALPKKASIMSHPDIWDAITRRYYKNKQQASKAIAECNKLLKYGRSARRWVPTPNPSWDANGNLLKIDFRKFDKAVQEQFNAYGQPSVITRAFMLGYGHILRNTLFGPKNTILTPIWKKKLTQYATKFLQHLEQKGWRDKVILDLFDEPNPDTIRTLTDTIDLLRSIYPKWRFTAATDYVPGLKGKLNYWNFAALYPSIATPLIEQGDIVTVYNPPATRAGCSLANMRAYGWYLHRYNIKYTYQWCTNIWREWKERGGLDLNREASWIAPGPEGVRSTLRFEAMRDYLEDYELLTLLEKAIAKAKAENLKQEAITGEKLLEEAGSIARVPENETIPYLAAQDVQAIPVLREKIGNYIDKIESKK